MTEQPAIRSVGRGLPLEESKRLDALCDAEDILTALYYQTCEPGHGFLSCPKCGWLLRVLGHIENEQEELSAPMFPDRRVPGSDIVPLQEHEKANR